MKKIRQITIITQQGVGITNVGENGIELILDESLIFEDHVDRIYCCYDKQGYLIKRIENCPCDISFLKENK